MVVRIPRSCRKCSQFFRLMSFGQLKSILLEKLENKKKSNLYFQALLIKLFFATSRQSEFQTGEHGKLESASNSF